jgi:4-diphosphocytidyl-2-C-methyl-D-erythritol kinase
VIQRVIIQPVNEWVTGLSNDFEPYVFDAFPEVQKIKECLYNEGALFASMTGSGSSVYGIFKHKKELKPWFPKYYYWAGSINI